MKQIKKSSFDRWSLLCLMVCFYQLLYNRLPLNHYIIIIIIVIVVLKFRQRNNTFRFYTTYFILLGILLRGRKNSSFVGFSCSCKVMMNQSVTARQGIYFFFYSEWYEENILGFIMMCADIFFLFIFLRHFVKLVL